MSSGSACRALGGVEAPRAWPAVDEGPDRPLREVDRGRTDGILVSTLLRATSRQTRRCWSRPCEVHPIYNVTGVEWLAENKPEAKTAVICAQDDLLGKPSVATYLAAFEAAGIKVLGEPMFFDPATTDFAPMMTKMLAKKPDIVCLDTCYADYVHPLTSRRSSRASRAP